MASNISLQIGDRCFKSKTELKTFVKAILHKYEIGVSIRNPDLDFISLLLKRHPEYSEKVGNGIQSIVVRKDKAWGKTKCFYIVRIDGTYTDFSYIHCIDNDTSQESIKMFKASARNAVSGQVIEYLKDYFKYGLDSENHFVCEISKIKVHKDQAHVDHIPPITFAKIVKDFIKSRNIDPAQIEFVGFNDNEFKKQFKNENLKTDFQNYHRQVAKLRVVGKRENLTQKKKNFN
jgi:hypothetical protein